MESISKADLPALFAQWRQVFTAERERLIALDGQVGDSDLGITMNKAFIAAHESMVASAAADNELLGRSLQKAGMAMAKAAPSTMGTLVATGFMRGGKALDNDAIIGTAQLAHFFSAFLNGVIERGKAKRGDKTVVDVLAPVAESLAASRDAGAGLDAAITAAAQAAAAGLESTKTMVAQHGKAACFQDKTLGLQDAGATVADLLVQTLLRFVQAAPMRSLS